MLHYILTRTSVEEEKKKLKTRTTEGGFESMEYFMMPTEKIPSLQHFKKTEKDVIGGLCRCVAS